MKKNSVIKTVGLILFNVIVSCNEANKESQKAVPFNSSDFKLKGSFYCNWWFENEMDYDINNVPPKKNYRLINNWEYSDPVAVPHPDTVDFKISIVNNSVLSDSILIQYSPKIYYLNINNDTLDISINSLDLSKSVFLNSHDSLTQTLYNIPIGLLVDSLTKLELIPFSFSVNTSILTYNKKEVKKDTFTLPIIVGD